MTADKYIFFYTDSSDEGENFMNDRRDSESIVPVSRRSVLKAGAVSAVGIGLFSGTASATDDTIDFTVECIGDEVKVTLIKLIDFDDGSDVDPSTLTDLKVVFGKEDVIDIDGNGSIARLDEIRPCVAGDTICQPAATADGSEADVQPDGSLCFRFSRKEAGLGDETGTVPVAFAGTYFNDDRSKDLGSFDGVTELDLSTCCIDCEDGEELLVKYEWEDGEFVTEGSDGHISLDENSIVLDEDGEPQEICFDTTYCDVDAAVKAGQEYTIYEDEEGRVCVEGIDGKAISNVQFFCEAPEDVSVGNSGGNGNGRGR